MTSPSTPFSCPRCDTPAPGPGAQTCSVCHKPFTLYTGCVMDPSLSPSPGGPKLQVKSPGAFLMRYGVIDERGVAEGALDPVVALVPVDTSGVAWHDVVSIAFWRSPAWTDLVVALLIPLPIAFGLGWLAMNATGAAIPALFFATIGGVLLWRALGVMKCQARIIGRYRTIIVRFDRPFWRRRQFHDELVRRAGGTAGAMP